MFHQRGLREFKFRTPSGAWNRLWLSRLIAIFLPLILLLPLRQVSSQRIEEFDWKAQKSGIFARLSSVFFVDRMRGWVVGSNGTLVITEDGGENWRRRTLPERQKKEMVRDVRVLNPGGDAERLCLLGEYSIISPRGAYNITERTFVLISTKGEEKWTDGVTAPQPYRRPDKALGRVSVNEDGKTQVNDTNMHEDTLRTPEPILLRMSFINDRIGWACGESGVIQITEDGGETWKLQFPLTRKLLYDVAAIDRMQVWVVGAGGTILHTVNGGQSWEEQNSEVTDALRAVRFIDSKRGWAVGSNGRIIVTSDGGSHWQKQKSNYPQNLNDLFFINDKEGWIAGDRGAILHTRDGGENWEGLLLETHANLTKLFFVGLDCGWVVGGNGVIFKYGPNE